MSGVVGASTLRSGSPATAAPLVAAAVAAAPTLAALLCRVVTRGVRGGIEDPSHQDRAGRGHMSPKSHLVSEFDRFIYLFIYLHQSLHHRAPPFAFRRSALSASNRTVRDLAPQKKVVAFRNIPPHPSRPLEHGPSPYVAMP